jgi:hypothetical protein
MHLCVPPKGDWSKTEIKDGKAIFEAEYPMACTRTVFNKETFPKAWRCRQHWTMDEDRMVGEIQITSEKKQLSRPPTLRIRFGKNLDLRAVDSQNYRCGPFALHLTSDDFDIREITPGPIMLTKVDQEAMELLARQDVEDTEKHYQAGESFSARVTISL